jgi:DHA2 family multidrug resistance protein-like MFS transporter
MSNEFGSTLGIALLGSVATAVYRHEIGGNLPGGVTGDAAASAHDSVNGAAVAASQLPDQVASALLSASHAAFANSLNVVAGIGAVLLAGVAILIATLLRHVPPIGQTQQAAAQAADGADGADGEQPEAAGASAAPSEAPPA